MNQDVITVAPIETKKIGVELKKANIILKEVMQIKIKTGEENRKAVEFLKEIKKQLKEIEIKRKSITVPLDTAKKSVQQLFKPVLEEYLKAERIIKRSIVTFQEEQERIRIEQEEKLRKQAEQEEVRKNKLIDARILKAEEQGKDEKVEELKEIKKNISVQAPILAPVEKIKGVSFVEKWSAEVVNFKALPDSYKIANQLMLNKIAQATKGTQEISGVTFHCKKEVRSS